MGWSFYNAQGSLQATDVPTLSVMTMVNVKDYGAKGDGSTNDQAAIQLAINAAAAMGVSARGVDVYFPAGVYAIGSTITVPFNNVMLRGAGWQSTVLYATFTTTDILQIGNGTSKSGCGLMNMSIWCSAARTTGASININTMHDCLIQNFVVNNCFVGILVQGASLKVWIDQGEINNIYVATGSGIQISNGLGGDTYITNIVSSNPPASKPLAGIDIIQAGHVSILRCNMTSCVYGLYVHPGANQDVSYLFIDHTLFDSCGTYGAYFFASNATLARIRSVICLNSWFSGTTTATAYGIFFDTAGGTSVLDDLSFIGCRILNNQNHGVQITAGTNISFTDCTIAGNGQQTINTFDGINILAAAGGISIVNCKIGQAGTATNQQRYAINVGASPNTQFINNDCQPNGTIGTHGYINVSASGGGYVSIVGNLPQLFTGMGASTVAASAAINTTETLISSLFRMGANALRPGTTIRFVVAGSCTVTTAAAVPTFRIRMGTAGTVADAIIMTFTLPTSGGVGTSVFKVIITLTCRTVGAAGTFQGDLIVSQASASLGLLTTVAWALAGTAATGSTINNNYLHLTYQGASANVTCTFQKVATIVDLP